MSKWKIIYCDAYLNIYFVELLPLNPKSNANISYYPILLEIIQFQT